MYKNSLFHIFGAFILCCLPANAQLVNIETYRIKNDSTRFSALASLTFAYSKQNADELLDAGSSGLVKLTLSPQNYLLLLGSYRLLKSENNKHENSRLGHLRYTYKFKPWLAAEAFSQYQSDEKRALKHRVLTGAGPRFQIFATQKWSSAIGCLYMTEWEELTWVRTLRITPHTTHRFSSYVAANWLIGEDIFELTTVTYYQPKITEFANYRISNNTSIDLNITKRFAFGFALNYNYDSFPPRGILKNAFSTTAGVKLKL
ncbi:hypothetical protein FACS1894182_12350 [Bacteroidia bacterium]|nr:hypothetical protein FACS1894182_12350 [Bacteroidia bacterium]